RSEPVRTPRNAVWIAVSVVSAATPNARTPTASNVLLGTRMLLLSAIFHRLRFRLEPARSLTLGLTASIGLHLAARAAGQRPARAAITTATGATSSACQR